MASNGSVTNPKKTAMVFLRAKKGLDKKNISIIIGGEQIEQQEYAKLLGVTFTEKLKWKENIYGKGGTTASLNQRLYLIKRLKNSLNLKSLTKVAESIYTSKLRYGLQLQGKIKVYILKRCYLSME